MDAREQRGIVIAAVCKLNRKGADWVVPSQSLPEKTYTVNPWKATCSCPDHQEAGQKCKHIHAVHFTIQREIGTDGTVTETKSITFTEKKTYRQNWGAYNLAQTIEKDRLQELLSELCRAVPEPEAKQFGRARVPMNDRLFSIIYKVYCGLSTRRFACDLAAAKEKGYTERTIHPSKVSHFFTNAELTPILKELVERTSLPLRAVETNFAVDSTGFSVARHVRWIDEKYGCQRSGRDWVKVHICTGVKTNVVTAVEIKGRDAGDCPIMPQLVSDTAKNFKINDVTADKAYLSQENVETVAHFGGTAFIEPKSNTTGGIGGLFEKMYHFYKYRREEFMDRYHQRSNVESTFSAVKRKFGDSVRSRNDVAMVNECLCKFICHNITCIIQSQCELGIEAEFWADKQAAAIIPMHPVAV